MRILKILADYVMVESRRVEIVLKYKHEDVLLSVRKGELSSGPCNFFVWRKMNKPDQYLQTKSQGLFLIYSSKSTMLSLLAANSLRVILQDLSRFCTGQSS